MKTAHAGNLPGMLSSSSSPFQKLFGLFVLWAVLAAGLTALRLHWIGVGQAQERASWQARERLVERHVHETYAENVRLGNRAAALALADEAGERRHAAKLTLERRHARLTAPARPPRLTPELRPPRGVRDADEPSVTATAGLDPADGDGGRGLVLTAGAVRLWNSALAGRDVPAGACGADATPAAACAADTGLTLAEAWDNQAANALSCRLDRARLSRLQDYLRQTRD